MNISISPDALAVLTEHILTHPDDWGVLTPDECQEIADGLLYLRWLVRTDRLRDDCPRWLP